MTQLVLPVGPVRTRRARVQEVMAVVVHVLAYTDSGLQSEQTRAVKRDGGQ